MVDVHVREAFLGVIAPRPHIGVRDRFGVDLLGRKASRGEELRNRFPQLLVDPPIGQGAVAAGHIRPTIRAVARPLDLTRRLDDAGAALAKAGRKAIAPQVRRLDDVIVHRDDPRQIVSLRRSGSHRP